MHNQELFKIEPQTGGPIRKKLVTALGRPIGKAMGFKILNNWYKEVSQLEPQRDFMSRTLDVMHTSYNVTDEDMARIPQKGPVIVVANHPFGAIEGVVLGSLLQKVRPDFKIMGNYFLWLIPELKDMIIPVDVFERDDSARKNITPLKECMRCLRDGHMLSVFPAGEVAHLKLRNRHVMDPPWSPTISRIIRKTKSPVLPIYFDGANSPLFQLLGLVHPRLRTVMLTREFTNMEHKTVNVTIGKTIPFKKLSHMESDLELISYLRLRTHLLKQRHNHESVTKPFFVPKRLVSKKTTNTPEILTQNFADMAPIPDAPNGADLQTEINSLSSGCFLLENGELALYIAKAKRIPKVLNEIGRLREYTFRQVGEGTGKALDLDHFDDYYLHLFIWNKEKKEIAGAYRIGPTDKIIAEHGVEGLYTSTLFNYKPALFDNLGRALEMGRSFVRPEYQKSYAPLLLLWKAISIYVLRHPDYITLFGPVSISNDYSALSKELLIRYLKTHNSFSKYSKLVKPKNPAKFKNLNRHQIREFRNFFKTVDDMTHVITDLETEFRGVPVLIKQYLKLGGKVMAFNVDPDFQNCVDGLIMVDLLQTNRRVLGSYMGRDNVDLLHEYHENKHRS